MSTISGNPVQYALQQIKHKIPKEILSLAFKPQYSPSFKWGGDSRSTSIDSLIKVLVIDARVNEDCNLKGGSQVLVDLRDTHCEVIDHYTRVYRIPYHLTGGKRIISTQNVSYRNMAYGTPKGGNQLATAVTDMYRAMSSMPVVDTAEVTIIGDNIISVKDSQKVLSDHFVLTCTVENDPNMSNLQPGTWKTYAKLVELAVKAYIYNNTVIPLDQGQVSQGVNLGSLKEIIDRYSDADEQYEEYYAENWGKTIRTNDKAFMSRFIRSQMGRGQ